MKTAVITGAASGIGLRTAERLLSEGWTVWALDISEVALSEMASALGRAGSLRCVPCDVSSPASVATAFETITRDCARIDGLVCSAGLARIGPLVDHSPEEVDLMLGVNVRGPWLTVRQALPLLQAESSVDEPARVVMVGSVGGIRPRVGTGFYSATKAALHAITGVLAVELGPTGVLVNAVAPGTVDTPMSRDLAAQGARLGFKPSGASPLGRVAVPDDVADAILYFLGDSAKFINGVVLPVDGGSRAAFVKT